METGKKVSGMIRIGAAFIPVMIAFAADHDLSSQVHIPVIGITGVCVALCDALCGQIIANTRWLPFCAFYNPAEAQVLAKKFRNYHKSMFTSWMIAKICSAVAVTISASMLIRDIPEFFVKWQLPLFAIGYVFLGTSLVTSAEFIVSYFMATKEADDAKLREMNYAYKKEHPELFVSDTGIVKHGFGPSCTGNLLRDPLQCKLEPTDFTAKHGDLFP